MPGQDTPLSQTAEVPVMKIQHLAAEARSLDVAELRDHVPSRRYTLVVSLLYSTQIQTQDQLVTMLIKRMAAIHQQAREKLETLLRQERSTMESWMQAMADITRAVAEGVNDTTLGTNLAMEGLQIPAVTMTDALGITT